MNSSLPTVAVFRDLLWHANEPFILNQSSGLRRFQARYFGVGRVTGLASPPQTFFLNRGGYLGRFYDRALKRYGFGPSMVRAMRAAKAAILHAYTGVDGAVAMPLARQLRIPLVVTFTGFDVNATEAELLRSSLRCQTFLRKRDALGREAGLIITVSDFLRQKLLARGYPEERTIVHYTGVDTEVFRADDRMEREPVVLFVGRLIPVKGVTHLISALRDVRRRVPDVRLVLAGDGPQRRALEQQARGMEVPAEFLGSIPAIEVRRWMNRARVLAAPSVRAPSGETEALSMVVLEAQAMALPVAAFDSGGIREAVGENGLLAPEADVSQLGANIEALLTRDELWHTISVAGRHAVNERFNLTRQTAILEDLYDQVLARHRGASV
jgi:glycosyltransferase involved in cell wall biosynthesis